MCNALPMQLKNGRLVSEFVQGQSLEEVVLEAVERKNKFEVCRILDMVYQEILSSSQHIRKQRGNPVLFLSLRTETAKRDPAQMPVV